MYNINLNKYFNLLSWDAMYLAFRKEILDLNTVMEYAYVFLENRPKGKNDEVLDLILTDDTSKENILLLMNRITSDNAMDNYEKHMRIIRYIVLSEIVDNQNDKDILCMLENVYADFEYPKDMECFIPYMPCDDNEYNATEHTFEENRARMINKFISFMHDETEWIGMQS